MHGERTLDCVTHTYSDTHTLSFSPSPSLSLHIVQYHHQAHTPLVLIQSMPSISILSFSSDHFCPRLFVLSRPPSAAPFRCWVALVDGRGRYRVRTYMGRNPASPGFFQVSLLNRPFVEHPDHPSLLTSRVQHSIGGCNTPSTGKKIPLLLYNQIPRPRGSNRNLGASAATYAGMIQSRGERKEDDAHASCKDGQVVGRYPQLFAQRMIMRAIYSS